MKITFLGDVHAKIHLIPDIPNLIQVGDLGIGFVSSLKGRKLPKNFRFIRGNHDSPEECRNHPCYLGDFGYIQESGIFYVSGALSIDKHFRQPFVNWWPDEELNYQDSQKAMDLYAKEKPSIVVSHTCPYDVAKILLGGEKVQGNTEKLLQMMYDYHKPYLWVFGHFHMSKTLEVSGRTTFRCLDELEIWET